MAHLLNVENVVVSFASRRLLDAVCLGLDDGMRIGIVGRNGDGKSTLLRVLARRQAPDSGRVTHSRGLRLGMLDQGDALDPASNVRRTVLGDAPDHVWATDPGIRDVLTGLLGGLDACAVGGLDAVIGSLSGGQRRRVALAALLTGTWDVLLLDEPTNHLDVESVAWLARHLGERWTSSRGGLVVVTHDRWFLDAVCDRTWEVHDGTVDAFDGGYAAWVLARAERDRRTAVAEERRANLLRKELAWLRRGAPARTSKPRFRLDAAAALIAHEPAPRDQLALQRMATARLGKDVLDLEQVAVTFGTGPDRKELLRDVTWRLGPGERVGIVGVNGSGKSTLLRLLLGDLEPTAGRVRRGSTVRAAILSQEVRELDEVAQLRVQQAVEHVRGAVRVGDREVTAGQLLERLGFTRERLWTLVGELSGGERRRLQLLRLMMGEPNVLLLDEPTNDLDTDTLAAVEDALDGWPGTLVVASHDRYLLERVTDHQVALLGDGGIRDLPGGVEEYLALRARATENPDGTRGSRPKAADRTKAVGRASEPDTDVSRAEGGADANTIRQARKDMARLERRLNRLQEQEKRLHEQMAGQATDHEAVLALDQQLRSLQAERGTLEEEWLLAAEIVP